MLNEIYFGKTDAYNEFVMYGRDIFKELFYVFPSFQVEKFLNGEAYYIHGDKGTGKTMLLKYIESVANERPTENFTEFIRFKKDVDNDDRNSIKRASIPQYPFEEIIEKTIPSDLSINCTIAWQVYIIKVIIGRLKSTEVGVFERDENWDKLLKLINAIYDDDSKDIKRILPRIKKGYVEVNIAELGKINLELEWADEQKKTVQFNSIAKKIISIYSTLVPRDCNIYILIDELELTLNKNKDYERDITLIRDLIIAIQYLNEISKIRYFNVFVIAALRNEVYKNVRSKGMEINKPIHDFGVPISWQQKGGDLNEHPLIKMIEKRIQKSEIEKFGTSSNNIWQKYFDSHIGVRKEPIKNYLLNLTWFKPRDIIRLLTIIQERKGTSYQINQSLLDAIRQAYSEECWEEFAEELRAKYSEEEVEGIKQALIGINLPFEIKEFEKQIEGKKDIFSEVEKLSNSGKKIAHIMRDLYDVGIVGNYGKVPRFSFRGDKDIDPMAPLTIHYPLIRFFKASITSLQDKYKKYDGEYNAR